MGHRRVIPERYCKSRASVTVVCTATAWKMEAAIFSFGYIFGYQILYVRFAEYPQREAIEYT